MVKLPMPLTSGCVTAAPPSTASDTLPRGTASADATATVTTALAGQLTAAALIVVVVVAAMAGGAAAGAAKTMNVSTSVRVPIAAALFVASTFSSMVCVPGDKSRTNITRRVSEPEL